MAGGRRGTHTAHTHAMTHAPSLPPFAGLSFPRRRRHTELKFIESHPRLAIPLDPTRRDADADADADAGANANAIAIRAISTRTAARPRHTLFLVHSFLVLARRPAASCCRKCSAAWGASGLCAPTSDDEPSRPFPAVAAAADPSNERLCAAITQSRKP